MRKCTVKLPFCAAKRLSNYDGKCGYLHGYSHEIEVTFIQNDKNSNSDMVIDFYLIKDTIGKWLNDNWDHNILLHKNDKPLGDVIAAHTGQKPFYLDNDPTSENISEYLLNTICPELFPNYTCCCVKVYDTPDAWAESVM